MQYEQECMHLCEDLQSVLGMLYQYVIELCNVHPRLCGSAKLKTHFIDLFSSLSCGRCYLIP